MNKKYRIILGIVMFIFGILTGFMTYKYIFPIGSIMMIGSGFILIFMYEVLFKKS